MVQVGSTECKYSGKFEIVITVFSFYITFKKMLKTHIWNWFSIKKPFIKRYWKVNLHVIPKFLLETVNCYLLSSMYQYFIKCFVRRNKIRLFFYIKQRLHLLQIKIYQKNLKWTFAVLKITSSYHTVQVAALQNIYFENKVGSSSDSPGIFMLEKVLFCVYGWYHITSFCLASLMKRGRETRNSYN